MWCKSSMRYCVLLSGSRVDIGDQQQRSCGSLTGHHTVAPRGRGTPNGTYIFIHNSGMVVQFSLLGIFGYTGSCPGSFRKCTSQRGVITLDQGTAGAPRDCWLSQVLSLGYVWDRYSCSDSHSLESKAMVWGSGLTLALHRLIASKVLANFVLHVW